MKTKGIVSANDWDTGVSGESSSEKAQKIVEYLGTLAKGEGAMMVAIKEGTGLKWPYSAVKVLVKAKTVEQKKVGKALAYRLRK